MKKVLLLSLLVLLLVVSIPPLRAFASPVLDPLGVQLAKLFEPVVVKVQTPFFEWKAKDETRTIVNLMRDQEAIGQPLPRTREFHAWLQRRHRANRDGLDPWGMPYYVKYTDQGAVVGSPGPDLEPNTADDITEVLPRRLR